MKVLVTGVNGFLGSTLVRHLLNAGYNVRGLIKKHAEDRLLHGLNIEIQNGDIRNAEDVEKAVDGCRIVFHLASLYKFYPWWKRKTEEIYQVNVEGAKNLLKAALRNKIERFIFTSSIAALDTSSISSHYARSKLMAEKEIEKACSEGLPVLILRPAIILGAGDWKPTPSGEIILKFLNREYLCYFETKLLLADADDVAKAHISAIRNGRIGEKYILCDKEPHALTEIFRLLEEISGIKAPTVKIPYHLLLGLAYCDEVFSGIVFKKSPLMPTEGLKFCRMQLALNNKKAVEELGYTPTVLRETLTKAVNWYRNNGYVKNA